MRTKSRVLDAQ